MKRIAALAFGFSIAAASALADECVPVPARDLISSGSDLGRAIGDASGNVRISKMLLGDHAHAGDVIDESQGPCGAGVQAGKEYILKRFCVHGDCYWVRFEPGDVKGDLDDYVRHRHVVTPADIIAKLHAWHDCEIGNADVRRWLETAAADDDEGDGTKSAALMAAAIEETESLVDVVDAAGSCRPESAGWLRELGSNILLAYFARLPPPGETFSEYNERLVREGERAWQEWNAAAMQRRIEAALMADPAWTAAQECLDRPSADR